MIDDSAVVFADFYKLFGKSNGVVKQFLPDGKIEIDDIKCLKFASFFVKEVLKP